MQINKHGSFYIRNGWPTKIIDAVDNNTLVFSPNSELEAVDNIGVGRVMIKAMRYWATAMGITSEIKTQQGVAHELTPLGMLVKQFDPYCQNVGTLWALHRNLVNDVDNATAWYWAFNEMGSKVFTKDSFVGDFNSYLQKMEENMLKQLSKKNSTALKTHTLVTKHSTLIK